MTLSYHGQGNSDKNDWKVGWNIARGQCFIKLVQVWFTSVGIVFTLSLRSYPSSSVNVEDNYNTRGNRIYRGIQGYTGYTVLQG